MNMNDVIPVITKVIDLLIDDSEKVSEAVEILNQTVVLINLGGVVVDGLSEINDILNSDKIDQATLVQRLNENRKKIEAANAETMATVK